MEIPMDNTSALFERSVLVSYEATAFSPSRDASVELASATRKKKLIQQFMDPVKLRPLNAFKQEAFRACRQHGTKLTLLDAYVVDEQLESAIWTKLTDIQRRWNEFTQNALFPKYEGYVQACAKANPAEALDIIALAPSRAEIERATRFSFACIRLTSSQIRSPNLDQEVRTLADQALDDIAAEVQSAKVASSSQFTQATKQLMQRLRRKAQALAFLHPRLDELQAVLGRTVEQLPATGVIRGADAVVVKATLLPLLDPEAFKAQGYQAQASSVTAPITVQPVQATLPETVEDASHADSAGPRAAELAPESEPAHALDWNSF